MTRRSLTLALALSVALNLSAALTMAYCRWVAPVRPLALEGAQPAAVRAALGLTQEQKQQVQEIHRAFLKQAAPLRARTQAKNLELVTAAIKRGEDQARLSRLLEESAELHRKIQAQAADCLAREAAVLSPNQRTQLAQGIARNIRSSSCARGSGAGMGLGVMGERATEQER